MVICQWPEFCTLSGEEYTWYVCRAYTDDNWGEPWYTPINGTWNGENYYAI